MRILFISDSLLTGDFVLRLQAEGHEVKLYIADFELQNCYANLITKVSDWQAELDWVGKDGLIIFDDVGYGKAQDQLRADGYTVFGGTEISERLETDRQYGQQVFAQAGLDCLPTHDFASGQAAIDFISENPGPWVIKYSNSHWMKSYAFLGEEENGSDVIAVLKNYQAHNINTKETVTVQKRVYGTEVGVGRYFNGSEWVGPIEYNVEHTHLFPGDIGPIVDEMGTVAWYATDESEKLYQATLEKMKPFLQEAGFRGDFDIGCIVNASGVFPLEATARLGVPAVHLQDALQTSSWAEFLHGIASGQNPNLNWQTGFGVVTSVVLPPFPYTQTDIGKALLNTKVHIRDEAFRSLNKSIHFDEVASIDGTFDSLYITGTNGYAFYATGVADTIAEARNKSLAAISGVYVPRMFYRNDIGKRFEEQGLPELNRLGYLEGLVE